MSFVLAVFVVSLPVFMALYSFASSCSTRLAVYRMMHRHPTAIAFWCCVVTVSIALVFGGEA